jgi:hypothetical protein
MPDPLGRNLAPELKERLLLCLGSGNSIRRKGTAESGKLATSAGITPHTIEAISISLCYKGIRAAAGRSHEHSREFAHRHAQAGEHILAQVHAG